MGESLFVRWLAKAISFYPLKFAFCGTGKLSSNGLTGGRLNEVVRLRLDQFKWTKGVVTLEATKTENQRDFPMWGNIKEIAQARIRDGLTRRRVFN